MRERLVDRQCEDELNGAADEAPQFADNSVGWIVSAVHKKFSLWMIVMIGDRHREWLEKLNQK
jgi:hypothetical protein